ncbi:GbsR/MarR family transcriptional regulator [Nonomuraea turcica]|uniref:GbsR/MarR family transcriptional regulator n=1 Tax=Nonomuraea sp. G32 TaxID=3067274 RepID=UPI00273BD9C1|nr:MarR family transcriptional regulator [Nonomuraea sp. G32]MDP4508536.1 MarR family transcriptional regulator [Nonomuraea sp. G32]
MTSRDERAVEQFVESTARMFAEWGFPRMAARVLLTMMCAEDDTLTAGELAGRLGVSPSAISGAVRYLIQIGLMDRRPIPGSRRDVYSLRDNAWYLSSTTTGGVYAMIADLADGGAQALGGPETRAGGRVGEMRDFFRFIQGEMAGLLEKWDKLKASEQKDRADG